MYSYITHGVCSKKINFDIKENKIRNVSFEGGCRGNLQGISKLIEGMDVHEVIKRLKGIQCQGNTSCPDQLATALEEALHKNA